MKYEQCIYPYSPETELLPFYLTGIGASRYQRAIDRPSGYFWHQILYCAEGSGALIYDGIEKEIKSGDFFLLPKNYPHKYINKENIWNIRWIAFDGYACDRVFEKFKMQKPIIIHADGAQRIYMENIIEKMYISETSDILYCEAACSGLVYEYILSLSRLMDNGFDSEKSRRLSMLLPVLQYINDNFRSDFSMTELSEMIGITPQHFCRIFKKTMNMRPHEYITKMRIDEAKRLLCDTEINVSEAALRSGFCDAGYFSTVFKKHVGVSPEQFRKNCREE